jgi:hypothetical protein
VVASTGAATRADRDRPLKAPRPIEVTLDAASGEPRTICEQGGQRRRRQPHGTPHDQRRCREVERVQDCWLVETEWWRPRPVKRHYYQLLLTTSVIETVYQDLVDGLWYAQTTCDPA